MIRFLIKVTNRLERELGWLLHFTSAHGFTRVRDIYLYVRGFAPFEADAYDFETHAPEDYVNAKDRFFGLPRVHGPYMGVLKDKSILNAVLSTHGFKDHLPTQFGKIYDVDDLEKHSRQLDNGKYIVKPSLGSGGSGVVTMTVQNGSVHASDDMQNELRQSGEENGQFVLEEYIKNHRYARDIFPGALNTIRLLTAWNYDEERPYVVSAAQRFGTEESEPTDNCSRGGVFGPVDLDSGMIGSVFTLEGPADPPDVHPDTQRPIKGVPIPHWTELKTFITEVAATLRVCPWIGWDLVIDRDDRFIIIEANPTPGLYLVQMDTPLRKNETVRGFLKHHSLL